MTHATSADLSRVSGQAPVRLGESAARGSDRSREQALRTSPARPEKASEPVLQPPQPAPASADFSRGIIETFPHGVLETDITGTIVYCNDALCRLLRLPRERIIGSSAWAFCAGEDGARRMARYVASLRMESVELEPFEARQMRSDGMVLNVEIVWSYRRNQVGHVTGFVGVMTDQSRRKTAEHELQTYAAAIRQQLEELESIYNSSPVGICLLDDCFRFVRANSALAGFQGRSPESYIGQRLEQMIPELSAALTPLLRRTLDTRQPVSNLELRACLNNAIGETRDWLLNAYPVGEMDGRPLGISMLLQDITEKKQAENARLRQEERRGHARRLQSLETLASGIAQDFNELLVNTLTDLQRARQEVDNGERVHLLLRRCETSLLRASDLTQQLFGYAGKTRTVAYHVDLGELIEHWRPMLEMVTGKRATINCRVEKRLPPVAIDVNQMRLLINNLVVNAAEAIGERHGIVTISTGTYCANRAYLDSTYFGERLPEGTYVFLEVSDTGCGIAPEIEARIFDPFFTTKGSGRGLGLSAVLGIVRAHNGTVSLECGTNRGATFRVLLPAVANVGDGAPAQCPQA